MNRFVDRTALVTGGAKGLGAAVAARLAGEGARVLVADRNPAEAREVVAALPGDGHAFLEAELSRPEDIERLCREVGQANDGLDVLVNNAAAVRPAWLEDVTDEDWDVQVAVNLRAPLLLTRGLVGLMTDRSAAVVNVSSEAGFRPRSAHAVYDTTKAGVGGLTRALADELWQYGIRVNEVAPGSMVTELHFGDAPDPEARRRELEEEVLPPGFSIMARRGRPPEVAAAVAFLASSDASFLTASTLHVDGGMGLG